MDDADTSQDLAEEETEECQKLSPPFRYYNGCYLFQQVQITMKWHFPTAD